MIKKDLYITLFMNWAVTACYNSKALHIFNMFLYNVIWYSKQPCKISRAAINISVLQVKKSEAQRG